MPTTRSLDAAKSAKNDEFYTQLPDIENELRHYKDHFRNKVVYCNCDDPKISNFFKYFFLNFKFLGLKKLITTCYKNQNFDLFSQHKVEKSVGLIYAGKESNTPNEQDIEVFHLKGDGDFRSQECVELLKQSDIVVTNPPFSLFREYVAQLVEYGKKFIVIGPWNAVTYKEIFPLIKENRFWLGYGFAAGNAYFAVSSGNEYAAGVYDEKTGLVKFRNVTWFTNLDIKKRHEELILFQKYQGNEENYPKYDNYDAIEISKTRDIPMDYNGAMGVPVTFLDKYNPDQFELLGATESEGKGFSNGLWFSESGVAQARIKGKRVYKRLFIRNKGVQA